MAEAEEQPATILVVDDELGMREGCRRALAGRGHTVHTAEDLAGGGERLDQDAYDLVLLDVMMPDGSGIDLIADIHRRDPDTTCIIITGFATVELAVDAVKRGAYDFLSKPFTTDQLLMAVNQGLERRRLSLEGKRLRTIEAEAAEMARAQAEMERLDQAKSQLMLKLAHELRAPTAAVQSYISLILGGYVPEHELRATLERIQIRLKQTLDTIGDLLELARLKKAGDWRSDPPAPQPMDDVLREVADVLRQPATAKEQTLTLDLAEGESPLVVAAREHLRQVWMNLLSNAIKYTPKGGTIRAGVRVREERLVGTVEDNGIGIASEDLGNLFQEFFRSDQAKASGEIGTGLGLSIVKQILDSYGGQIEVESALGRGTRFTFSLPLAPPP